MGNMSKVLFHLVMMKGKKRKRREDQSISIGNVSLRKENTIKNHIELTLHYNHVYIDIIIQRNIYLTCNIMFFSFVLNVRTMHSSALRALECIAWMSAV